MIKRVVKSSEADSLPAGSAPGHPDMLSGPAYEDSVPGPQPLPMDDLAGPFFRPQQREPFWDRQIRLIEALIIRPHYLGKEKKLGSPYATLAKILGFKDK